MLGGGGDLKSSYHRYLPGGWLSFLSEKIEYNDKIENNMALRAHFQITILTLHISSTFYINLVQLCYCKVCSK